MKNMTILAISATLLSVPAIAYAQGPEASACQADDSATENDPSQRIKCRRLAVTGSLIKKQKVCRTIAQWREMSQNGNRFAKDIVDTANQGFTNSQ